MHNWNAHVNTLCLKKKTAGKTEKVETEDKKKRNQQVVKQYCDYKGKLSLQRRWKQWRRGAEVVPSSLPGMIRD